jgi:hypothetical protein
MEYSDLTDEEEIDHEAENKPIDSDDENNNNPKKDGKNTEINMSPKHTEHDQ